MILSNKKETMKNLKKFLLMLVLFSFVATQTACWETPNTNKVLVQSIYGQPTQVVRPPGVWTIFTRGDEYAEVSLETVPTGDIDVRGQSADNASFMCKVRIQYSVPNNDAEILKLVAKFGFVPETRDAKILNSIFMELQSKISSKAKAYNAYDLLDKYEAVREPVLAEMKYYFTNEMHLVLENLQFVGKPDFDNNDIDTASSNTVAAQQKKNAALADLERVKVEAETKQVQAQTFAQSPQLMELERLKYQVQMTENLGKTAGILVFGENSPLTFTKQVK